MDIRSQGSRITSDWVTLESGLRCWFARPAETASAPGILLYIEAYGVNPHMRSVAERFARAGYVALIPDIFHGQVFDYADTKGAMGSVRAIDDREVMRESVEALAHLAANGVSGKPAIAGYCMGGRLAFLAGLELGARLSAVVSYYGGGIGPEQDHFGRSVLIERAAELGVPALFHYGGKDTSIAPAEHARIAAALSAAGKRYAISVYPEAGHAFNCDDRANYHAEAAAEAWELTQTFLASQRKD